MRFLLKDKGVISINSKKILIVDDDEGICETICSIFEEIDYEVGIANTGRIAIEKVKNQYFNAAIIDLKLPDMNGIEILKNFKEIHPDMVCMIVTGNATIENAINALDEGADGYFVKPTHMKEIIYKINDALKKQSLKKELKESEEKYRNIIENMSSGVAVYESINDGENFIFKDFNRAAERIENIKKEQVIGKSVMDVFPGIEEFGLFDVFKRVWKTGTPEHLPISFYKDCRIEGWRENFVYKLSTGEIVAVYDDISEKMKAKEKLEESEEKYRLITENANDLIMIINDKFEFEYINEKIHKKLMGYSKEELIGKVSLDFVHPNDLDQAYRGLANGLNKGNANAELRIKHKNGSYIWFGTKGRTFIDIDGKLKGIQISRDITERKRVEKELKIKDSAIASSINAIAITDLSGVLTYVNNSFLKMWGYDDKEELLGKSALEFWQNEDIGQMIIEKLRKEGSWIGELIAKRKDNSFFDVQLSVSTVMDKNGKPICMMGSFIDITERKEAIRELAKARDSLAEQVIEKTWSLAEEKRRIEYIINTISDGILVLDSDGNLALVNRTLKDYYQRIFNQQMPNVFDYYFEPQNTFDEKIKELFLVGKPKIVTIEPKEGLHLQFVSTGNSFHDKSSLGAIIEVRDVSPFVNFDNMRKQFVSTVSHELRTPITVIIQSLHNLKKYESNISKGQQELLLSLMSQNAKVLEELVNDLLLVSRIDEKRLEIEWSQYQPLEVLNDILMQMEPNRSAKEISIEVEGNEQILLYGDSKRIGQVFRIIIDNAIKYSDEKTKIKIDVIDHYKGEYNKHKNDGVLVRFSDFGRGIHEKDLPFLFDRFFRSEDVNDIPGTGLGLPIARDLTRLHKGDIFVESEYGKGSTFFVFLPRFKEIQSESIKT